MAKEIAKKESTGIAESSASLEELFFGGMSEQEVAELKKEQETVALATDKNIGQGEIQVARLGIAQPQTPEVVDGVEGWKAGMLFNTMSREILSTYGKPPWMLERGADASALNFMPCVVIFKLPTEFCKWPDKQERKDGMRNFHWKTLDQQDPRVQDGIWPPKGKWRGAKGESPPVTEHMNLLICPFGLNPNEDSREKSPWVVNSGNIILSASRTSYKVGKRLVSACAEHKTTRLPNGLELPWYGRVYYLFTELKEFDEGKAYIMKYAKGPKLFEFTDLNTVKNVWDCSRKLSLQFSEQEEGKGRALQEMYLDAAQFDEDEFHAPDDSGGSETDGVSSEPDF